MDKITIGYDDNLGLPSDFTTTLNCNIKPYHELNLMLADFEKNLLTAIFIPAGTLPYISSYQILAQSLFGKNHKKTLQTNFISKENITINEIPELTIGRVNQYCTTSFWAPQIYLMNVLKPKTTLTFKNTQSFPDMLHKTAEEIVDCSMTWDIIMQQHPNDSSEVHELFYKADLPSPVIISKTNNSTPFAKQITEFLSSDQNAFFRGFQSVDEDAMNQFLNDIEKAKQHFEIKIVT